MQTFWNTIGFIIITVLAVGIFEDVYWNYLNKKKGVWHVIAFWVAILLTALTIYMVI